MRRPARTVLNAVRLMYAGAVLEVLALIIVLVTRGSLKSAIFKRHPNYTSAQLHTAEFARTIPLIIGALIACGSPPRGSRPWPLPDARTGGQRSRAPRAAPDLEALSSPHLPRLLLGVESLGGSVTSAIKDL